MFQKRFSLGLFLLTSGLAFGDDFSSGAQEAVEGVKVGQGENPSMGLIFSPIREVGHWECGGTIVGPKWVFTTANCCTPFVGIEGTSWSYRSFLSFKAGATQLAPAQTWDLDKSPVQTISSRIHIHPDEFRGYRNNYCLLELDAPLIFSGKYLAPADLYRLHPCEYPKEGTTFIVYRWIHNNTKPKRDPRKDTTFRLEKIPCTVLSWRDCLSRYPESDTCSTFCCDTAESQRPDMESGVLASQLMFRNETGHLLLVGHELSFETNSEKIFSLASRASDWIKSPKPKDLP